MVMLHADPVCSEPKLFVGGLRFDISRDEVVTHFSQFGPIKSCVLLTHKDTGKPKGCAMVLYHKWGHAETAVEQNNGAVSDMSSPRPLIVKFADPQRRPEDGMLIGVTPKKLFMGQIPRAISQEQIRSICGPYGEIVDLNIMPPKRDNAMGCAFVMYATWAATEAAIEALNGTFTFPGAGQPIMVKLADAKPQDMQRVGAKRGIDVMGGGPAKRQMMGGMGRNMGGMMGGNMGGMMGGMGGMGNMGMMNPMMMNMMNQGMPGMMGQGMMGQGMGMMNPGMMGGMMGQGGMMGGQGQGGMMGQQGQGGTGGQGGGNQNWQQGQGGGMGQGQAGGMGQSGAMVDQTGQQGAAAGQDATGGMGGGMGGAMSGGMGGGMGGGMSGAMGNYSQGMNMNMPMGYGNMGGMGMGQMGMGGMNAMGGMGGMGGMNNMGGARKQGGVMGLGDQNGNLQAAKAWKLFIGQISFDMAEGDLFPFFSQFGTILELVLLRNQGDGRHKGCGFLVYSSAEEAEAALAANGAVMPNDVRQRQIMVKYANAKGN